MKLFISYNKKLLADGLQAILNQHSEMEVIGIAKSGVVIFEKLRKYQIDVLLIELDWPKPNTLTYLNQIRDLFPEVKTILVSNITNSQIIYDTINTGINSYILKCCGQEELLSALNHLTKNEDYFSPFITQVLLKNFRTTKKNKQINLTPRELEVLKLLAQMFSNMEIAQKLSISQTTVKTHRQNIMQKFGARNLVGLIRYACRENLIQDDSNEFCQTCPHKIPDNCQIA